MATNFRTISLCIALASLVAECGLGPSGDDLVAQTERLLSEAHPGCTIDVAFNGVGEGDSDHAYAAMRLESGPAGDRRSKDVEVLFSDGYSDRWEMHKGDATRLVDAAAELCEHWPA
jgi:hypothetical protein